MGVGGGHCLLTADPSWPPRGSSVTPSSVVNTHSSITASSTLVTAGRGPLSAGHGRPPPGFENHPVASHLHQQQPHQSVQSLHSTTASGGTSGSFYSLLSASSSSLLDDAYGEDDCDTPLTPIIVPSPPSSFCNSLNSDWASTLNDNLLVNVVTASESMEITGTLALGAAYYQCRNTRRSKQASAVYNVTPGEHVGNKTPTETMHLGNFDSQYDNSIINGFIGTRNSQDALQQNMSCSFDPRSYTCLSCNSPHSVLSNKNGNGCPVTLILSDQNFPPNLYCPLEGQCAAVIRIEDASLSELVDIVIEIFPDGLPNSTIILLGSGTHLLRTGSAGYARAWVECNARLASLSSSSQICPLPPMLSGPAQGNLFRSVVELNCWLKEVYGTNTKVLGGVWSHLLSTLSRLTSHCPPLSTPDLYTVTFPTDLSGKGSKPFSFSSCSSGPGTVSGLDRKATMELLLALFSALNCDLFANLDPELNLPRILPPTESPQGAKELHLVLMGGSHMKRLTPILEAQAVRVTDLSTPGWVTNNAATQTLMDTLSHSLGGANFSLDTVFVMDFLGNSSVRFRQEDDNDSLPCKIGGSFHLLGRAIPMEDGHVTKALGTLEHLYNSRLRDSKKIFIPPIPRYIFGGCCNELSHCPNVRSSEHAQIMLSEHCRIRHTMKSTLIAEKVANMRVLDILGSLTNRSTLADQLEPLKRITARDNVHLTHDGYIALASGIVKEAQYFLDPKQKGSKLTSTTCSNWHNFVSYANIGKINISASTPSSKHSFKAPRHSTSAKSRPYGRGRRGR